MCLKTRDWNEELQTTRELPRKNLPERLLRERAIFKVLLLSCSAGEPCLKPSIATLQIMLN